MISSGVRNPSILLRGTLWFMAFFLLSTLHFHGVFTSDLFPVAGDAHLYNYPMRVFYDQTLKSHEFPLWTPYEFAGMPFVALLQTGTLYPLNIAAYGLLPAPHAYVVSLLLHFALAGSFTFLFLRSLGLRAPAAFLGGSAFVLSGFMVSNQMHTAILNSAVWLPLIIYFLLKLKLKMDSRYALALGITVAVQVLAGNAQMCLYTYITAAVFVLFSIRELNAGARLRFALYCLSGFLLGFLIALPQLYSTAWLSGISMRPVERETMGYLFFRGYSVYLKTLPSLLFPGLYHGPNALRVPPSASIIYTGILPLMVATIVFLRNGRSAQAVRIWGTVAILSLFLAVAGHTPLGKILFHLPVYNMFRAHGRNAFEFSFAVSVLFALGLDAMLRTGRHVRATASAAAFLLLASSAGIFFMRYTGGEAAGIVVLKNPAIFGPLVMLAVYLAITAVTTVKPGKYFFPLVLIAFLVEVFFVGKGFSSSGRHFESIETVCREKGYWQMNLMEGGRPVRAASLFFQIGDVYNIPCGVSLLNSYDPFILKNYAKLFDLEFLGHIRYWDHLVAENSLLSMMNVKYLIVPKGFPSVFFNIENASPRPGYDTVLSNKMPVFLSSEMRLFKLRRIVEPGTYLVSFKARSSGAGKASLRMEVYSDRLQTLRVSPAPMTIYPGTVSGEFREYYRFYHSDQTEAMNIFFLSMDPGQPVEVKDLTIQRVEGYGPLHLGPNSIAYKPVFQTDKAVIYENNNALGMAYPVQVLLPARDVLEVKRIFEIDRVNPLHYAVLYEEDLEELGKNSFSNGTVSVMEYSPQEVKLNANFDGEGFLVLTEQYYRGWRAYVDGKETKIFKTNGVLRGVVVPAGVHEVVFRYQSGDFLFLAALSLSVTALVIYLLVKGPDALLTLAMPRREKQRD